MKKREKVNQLCSERKNQPVIQFSIEFSSLLLIESVLSCGLYPCALCKEVSPSKLNYKKHNYTTFERKFRAHFDPNSAV
jgi:hypothetical protein